MAPSESNLLLDRLMKEPTPASVDFVMKNILTSLNTQHLSEAEIKLMRDHADDNNESSRRGGGGGGGDKVVTLRFHHFADPSTQEQWNKFYEENELFITQGLANRTFFREAIQQNLPIDVAYILYRNEVIRFVLLKPYPENQIGAKLMVSC